MTNSRSSKVSSQVATVTTTQSITSTSFIDVTTLALTMPTNNGKSIIIAELVWDNTNVGTTHNFRFVDGASDKDAIGASENVADYLNSIHMSLVVNNTGQVVKIQAKTSANTMKIYGTTVGADVVSKMQAFQL